jgi:PKD repeat protein
MKFRELFRNKLENSEVIPGESVKKDLMRKLAKREFLRFNPSQFNIYYLGVIVAVVIAGALLLISVPDSKEKLPENLPGETIKQTDTLSIYVKEDRQINKELTGTEGDGKPVLKRAVSDKNMKSGLNPEKMKQALTGNTIPVPVVSGKLREQSIITEKRADKNLLQASAKIIHAAFEASQLSGCAPLNIKFYNKSTDFDSCRWMFGDGGFSSETNPLWIFDVEGDYRIILRVFRADGSEASASAIITVHKKPVARFEISTDKPVIPEDGVSFRNYSMDAARYKWEFGDGSTSSSFEPVHRYTKNGKFNVRLFVWSDEGCRDSLTVVNAFSGSGYYINFPNAFIPNTGGPTGGLYSPKSDEAAQVFHPSSSGVSGYQLKIFSKIGFPIFESNDVSIGWDGYFKGQLCEPGVYIWKVRGSYTNGEPFVKMGDVTLIKY